MNRRNIFIAAFLTLACIFTLPAISSCNQKGESGGSSPRADILKDSLTRIASEYPGEIGIAVIINDKDTIAVNDMNIYPMMSVFKLHQAIALGEVFDRDSLSLDLPVKISRASLDPHTWSPMLKEHAEDEFTLTVRDLLIYTLTKSDNNASNLMFKNFCSVAESDSIIAAIIPRGSFRMKYMEEEMAADHGKAYSNSTSPLGAATLINRLFSEELISRGKQEFIKKTLGECATGIDRISAPLAGKEGVKVYHKTGSGYRDDKGILAAHNDLAYITLPDGSHYALAVFVKDFDGDETAASEAISRISAAVYSAISD